MEMLANTVNFEGTRAAAPVFNRVAKVLLLARRIG
jgi:hypothetical protein